MSLFSFFRLFHRHNDCCTRRQVPWIGLKSWAKASLVFYFVSSRKRRGTSGFSAITPQCLRSSPKKGAPGGRAEGGGARKDKESDQKWETGLASPTRGSAGKRRPWHEELEVRIHEGTLWVSCGALHLMPCPHLERMPLGGQSVPCTHTSRGYPPPPDFPLTLVLEEFLFPFF